MVTTSEAVLLGVAGALGAMFAEAATRKRGMMPAAGSTTAGPRTPTGRPTASPTNSAGVISAGGVSATNATPAKDGATAAPAMPRGAEGGGVFVGKFGRIVKAPKPATEGATAFDVASVTGQILRARFDGYNAGDRSARYSLALYSGTPAGGGVANHGRYQWAVSIPWDRYPTDKSSRAGAGFRESIVDRWASNQPTGLVRLGYRLPWGEIDAARIRTDAILAGQRAPFWTVGPGWAGPLVAASGEISSGVGAVAGVIKGLFGK